MLRSDSDSSYTDQQGLAAASDAAASSESRQHEGVSGSDREAWLHQAPPFDLSQMDDNLLAFSESQVSTNTWLHLAGPYHLALLNDNLLSVEDCVSVSYMCQANPLFLPQMDNDCWQPSAVLGSAPVCFMCQANPLFMPVAHRGDKLSTVHASTATADAFLHLTAPFSLGQLDHDLLVSSGSKASMVAWLHLAPPFDLAALDDDLLSGFNSKANSSTDSWLHQAPPFYLAAMEDELLAGIITGAAVKPLLSAQQHV